MLAMAVSSFLAYGIAGGSDSCDFVATEDPQPRRGILHPRAWMEDAWLARMSCFIQYFVSLDSFTLVPFCAVSLSGVDQFVPKFVPNSINLGVRNVAISELHHLVGAHSGPTTNPREYSRSRAGLGHVQELPGHVWSYSIMLGMKCRWI